MTKFIAFIKKEMVLCISAIFALISILFVKPSAEYFKYIDIRVICLLFCLMIVVAGFQKCGLFSILAQKLLTGQKNMRFISLALVLLPFFCSMFITNDVALITFVPFTILILKLINRPQYAIKLIVLQTIAANLGSMATPIGNPQNLFLYAKYQIKSSDFFLTMLPLTIISFIALSIISLYVKNETFTVTFQKNSKLLSYKELFLFLGLFFLCLLSVFHILHYAILTLIVIFSLIVFDRKLFAKVDYCLLLTFICFFIFAGNIGKIVPIQSFLSEIMNKNPISTSIITSQVISNVPSAVLLSNFTANWKSLLLGTNIGGLGTPIASLASLISLKLYLKSADSKPLQYILFFTIANIVGLILLFSSINIFNMI